MDDIEKSINLLDELDNLSKVHWLEREDIDQIMQSIGKRIAMSLRIERVSIWLLNPEHTAIVSMGEFDVRSDTLVKNSVLYTENYPKYFEALRSNKILLAEDIHTNEFTGEFSADYSKPLGIESLMDVPVRIAGRLVGVMCFEKVGQKKRFTREEQTFALSLALVLASNLEARQRRAAQAKLEQALREKELLIKEINHRVKNNFAILVSLLRISKEQGKTKDPGTIYAEYEQRIMSMIQIHDLLYQTGNFTEVDLPSYVRELAGGFKSSHPELSKKISVEIEPEPFYIPVKTAIHMGLVLSEVFLNAIKHSNHNTKSYLFSVKLRRKGKGRIVITIGDNGVGFDFNKLVKQKTLGLPIIKDLCEGMDVQAGFPDKKSNYYTFGLKVTQQV